MTRTLPLLALLAAASASAGTPTAPVASALAKNPKATISVAPTAQDNPWRITAGAQWRAIDGVSFSNGSHAADYTLPAIDLGSIRSGYSDGYVMPDITGSSTQTWNWGYTSASQVQGNNIVLTGSSPGHLLTDVRQTLNTDWSDDGQQWGGFIQIESPTLLKWHGLSLSASAAYSYTPFDYERSALAFSAVRVATLSSTFSDSYSLGGVPAPAVPHNGTFNGPGPVISLQPVSSSGGHAGEVIEEVYASTLTNALDVDLHTLSFGPNISLEHGRLRGSLGLGFALNIAAWDATNTETLTRNGSVIARWTDSASGTEVLPGLYLQAATEFTLTQQWALQAQARYDWSQQLEGSVGRSSFHVDPTGWTLSLGVQYRF